MQIRTRLTLQFLLMGGIIMIIASAAIYLSSSSFRKDDFNIRLENKANITAKLLIEVEEIDANLLRRIEKDNPVNLPKEKIIIFNYKNDILYSSDEEGAIKIDTNLLDKIRLDDKIRFKQGPYEVLGMLYTERFDRFVVIAAATDIVGFLKLKNLKIILFIVFLTSLILFSFAGWFYAGKALQPISSVVKQVEDISITSLNLRVDEGNGADEIAMLARTFNKMLERLEVAFKTQKDFISNASHELRTPLTSINGQLEVLLMKDRSSADYKKVVESVLEDIRNIIDLSNRLLLLAHTSSESSENLHNRVRIDEIIWQSTEELKRFNANFNINISIDNSLTDSDQMIVMGDEYLLKTAISNIVENACKYSDDHSVIINLECTSGWISISFIDHGIGINEGDLALVFEPFYRGSNAKMITGHGIGLSLVHRIIKNHDGIINISSTIGEGTSVLLKLPSAC
ncbi:MAG: HAMP domain-containing sensor histidine kinase [Bacteroidales bacterium]|nr:HAMP domain-containing sensor histidine kinase [Bacteroidales bacterium]